MNSKRNCDSCGKRLSGSGKRSITGTSMRIFISARVYPSRVPNDGLQEDNDTIDEKFNERNNANSSNVESDDQILDDNESDENDSNGADMDFNEKDEDGEIMDDNGSNESISDGADMDKSTRTDRSNLKLTVEVAIASKSQCCVCRVQLNPPTMTVKKEDRDNMFVKRNIVIPKGSRCCKMHTVNGFLSHEAFSAITAYKVREEPFDFNHNMDTMQKLRTMVNSKKHINFDDGFSLSDLDYKNLTEFTRAQHDQILSYIPSSALKNSANRSPRCSVACLLMKLKLGLSNSVLASMLGIDNKRILKSLGIDVVMPSFLGPKQKQLDVQQANNSRFVTMLRWVVESVNSRIKRYKWFNQVIPNSSLPSIHDFMMITAALLNCFHTPMVNPSIDNDAIITHMNTLRTKSNELQKYLNDHQLTRNSVWDIIDLDHLAVTFPKLSLDEIRTFTVGNSS
ncbi:unnamed protein product [Rotaria sp. Silwood1]|nr:unnamed protein product [Rotaria sp. Silwood1]CAF4945253.1 unnamed protein product [Rotaria sp. Silwood1]